MGRVAVLVVVAALGSGLWIGSRAVEAKHERFDGAGYCFDTRAWPNGPYLGEMHPFIVRLQKAYAGLSDSDPCDQWARSHRSSAATGLRSLGYTVSYPSPGPQPPDIRRYYHVNPRELLRNHRCAYDESEDSWVGTVVIMSTVECRFDDVTYRLLVSTVPSTWTDEERCYVWVEINHPSGDRFVNDLGRHCYPQSPPAET